MTVEIPVRSITRYGWKPSLPDPRDLYADLSGLTYLPEVDLRHRMPPVPSAAR